jgi:hypothetical protein
MLFENTKTAASAMERLATGSKINQAQDDVAGSAIADRMTSQVLGLNMAVKTPMMRFRCCQWLKQPLRIKRISCNGFGS